MFREIKLEELPDLTIIVGNSAVTLDDLIRNAAKLQKTDRIIILVVEKTKGKAGNQGPDKDAHKGTTEQKVLKAWNGGEKTIKEICEITGLSYPTVRKYIPVTPAG